MVYIHWVVLWELTKTHDIMHKPINTYIGYNKVSKLTQENTYNLSNSQWWQSRVCRQHLLPHETNDLPHEKPLCITYENLIYHMINLCT